MGVYHFFGWFRKTFPTNINIIKNNQTVNDINISIDNLLIDMNGLFHNSAQKIFQYGNFKSEERLMKRDVKIINNLLIIISN